MYFLLSFVFVAERHSLFSKAWGDHTSGSYGMKDTFSTGLVLLDFPMLTVIVLVLIVGCQMFSVMLLFLVMRLLVGIMLVWIMV